MYSPSEPGMTPVKKWHTNSVLKGWGVEGEVNFVDDLPVTVFMSSGNVASVWSVKSFWERVKFLFHGEITIVITGTTHPPISLSCGDVIVKVIRK